MGKGVSQGKGWRSKQFLLGAVSQLTPAVGRSIPETGSLTLDLLPGGLKPAVWRWSGEGGGLQNQLESTPVALLQFGNCGGPT